MLEYSNKGKGLRKFIYSNGPRWLTTVKNEPKVPEDIPNVYTSEEKKGKRNYLSVYV